MARSTLTPVALTPDSSATTIASIASSSFGATGAGNGVLFTNSGSQILVVVSTGTTATLTVVVGSTVLGLSTAGFPVTLPGTAGTYLVGPFHSAVNQIGTGQVAIDTSSTTGLTIGVLQIPGVY